MPDPITVFTIAVMVSSRSELNWIYLLWESFLGCQLFLPLHFHLRSDPQEARLGPSQQNLNSWLSNGNLGCHPQVDSQ